MIVSQAQLSIANYQISIAQTDSGSVYCFKHDNKQADWEYFENLDSATDFIFSNIPDFKYVLKQRE